MAKKSESAGKLNGNGAAAGADSASVVATPSAAPIPNAPASAEQPQLTPEMIVQITALRAKIQLNVGQVVLSIMNLPRYRHQTLADLMHVVLDPLMRDRVAIAHTKTEAQPQGDEQNVAGIAIWATVSEAVDVKITEQIKAGAFPVRLTNEDWVSGDIVWLLDVIANDRNQATRVLTNFKQLSGDRPVKIHPIVARVVDPKVLENARARPVGETDGAASVKATRQMPEPQGNA